MTRAPWLSNKVGHLPFRQSIHYPCMVGLRDETYLAKDARCWAGDGAPSGLRCVLGVSQGAGGLGRPICLISSGGSGYSLANPAYQMLFSKITLKRWCAMRTTVFGDGGDGGKIWWRCALPQA